MTSPQTITRALYNLDAENAHDFAVLMIRMLGRMSPKFLRGLSGFSQALAQNTKKFKVAGIEFDSMLGLAAGFDKNAEILPFLPQFGFSFAEVGTVTPMAQIGNSRPRLFRHRSDLSIFNRMGFNNDGAEVVADRVKDARETLPSTFRVAINIGKNKATEQSQAHRDFRNSLKPFIGSVDFAVINVSSPNTPGLRSLQTTQNLTPIIEEVQLEASRNKGRPLPVFLKLAPDLSESTLEEILNWGAEKGLSGFVLTNTLGGEWNTQAVSLTGGWSGRPLTLKATEVLRRARRVTQLPIISVGGILSESDALERARLGADLIEIYSGWVFGGPGFPVRLRTVLQSVSKN